MHDDEKPQASQQPQAQKKEAIADSVKKMIQEVKEKLEEHLNQGSNRRNGS
jgi:hypothetical protein